MLRRGGGNQSPAPLYCPILLRRPSVGQTGTALGAAARKHLAAIGSRHTLTEPMHFGALTLLGLIGTNHSGTPPVRIMRALFKGLPATTADSGRGRQRKYLYTGQPKFPLHGATGIIPSFSGGCQPHFFHLVSSLFHSFSPATPYLVVPHKSGHIGSYLFKMYPV